MDVYCWNKKNLVPHGQAVFMEVDMVGDNTIGRAEILSALNASADGKRMGIQSYGVFKSSE